MFILKSPLWYNSLLQLFPILPRSSFLYFHIHRNKTSTRKISLIYSSPSPTSESSLARTKSVVVGQRCSTRSSGIATWLTPMQRVEGVHVLSWIMDRYTVRIEASRRTRKILVSVNNNTQLTRPTAEIK